MCLHHIYFKVVSAVFDFQTISTGAMQMMLMVALSGANSLLQLCLSIDWLVYFLSTVIVCLIFYRSSC